jgi:heat shock protein HslJ
VLGLLGLGLAGCATASSAHDTLWGTAWRLENLAGAGVLDRVEATLAFPETGRAAGNGSCNRFFGSVEIAGDSIGFGPLGSTRMACAEPVSLQEAKYLAALQAAERFALAGPTLLIYSKGIEQPLRFARASP